MASPGSADGHPQPGPDAHLPNPAPISKYDLHIGELRTKTAIAESFMSGTQSPDSPRPRAGEAFRLPGGAQRVSRLVNG